VSLVKFPISEGTLPMNILSDNIKICSCLQSNKVGGIVPVKQLQIETNIKICFSSKLRLK
jgi:hypothetical protein